MQDYVTYEDLVLAIKNSLKQDSGKNSNIKSKYSPEALASTLLNYLGPYGILDNHLDRDDRDFINSFEAIMSNAITTETYIWENVQMWSKKDLKPRNKPLWKSHYHRLNAFAINKLKNQIQPKEEKKKGSVYDNLPEETWHMAIAFDPLRKYSLHQIYPAPENPDITTTVEKHAAHTFFQANGFYFIIAEENYKALEKEISKYRYIKVERVGAVGIEDILKSAPDKREVLFKSGLWKPPVTGKGGSFNSRRRSE